MCGGHSRYHLSEEEGWTILENTILAVNVKICMAFQRHIKKGIIFISDVSFLPRNVWVPYTCLFPISSNFQTLNELDQVKLLSVTVAVLSLLGYFASQPFIGDFDLQI